MATQNWHTYPRDVKRNAFLVTGATGTVGPSIVNHLIEHGYNVRSYGLDEPAPGLFVEPIEHITGDINNETRLAEALDGIDVVFHLAALLHIENPSPTLAPKYQRINVDGSRLVALKAAQAGVHRLIYFSTVKVYGVNQREPVTEECEECPQTPYAQTKLAGEEAIRTVEGIETCVLRLSAVFGPRLKGSWKRLVTAIQCGLFIPIGNLQNAHSLTYVEDVAQAALLAANSPNVDGQIYNVVGYDAPRLQDILEAIYTAANRSVPPFRIPANAALLGAGALEHGLKLFGKRSPLTPDSIRQLTHNEVFSGHKLHQLGFKSQLTLDQSWQKTLAQMPQ